MFSIIIFIFISLGIILVSIMCLKYKNKFLGVVFLVVGTLLLLATLEAAITKGLITF